MSDIDESLMQAGKFLEDIAKNPQKVDCLDTFAGCKDIVKWLQKETKGELCYSSTMYTVVIWSSLCLICVLCRCE